jgi:hypothetical protein
VSDIDCPATTLRYGSQRAVLHPSRIEFLNEIPLERRRYGRDGG